MKKTEKTAAARTVAEKVTKTTKVKTATPKVKAPKAEKIVYHGVGRRKKAVARVFVSRGTGIFNVNGTPHTDYFSTDIDVQKAARPLSVASLSGSLDIKVNVFGGGKTAQADAVKLGIARSLVEFNGDLRPLLRKDGLLTVDARNKERKKYGQKAARRKFQFVKR